MTDYKQLCQDQLEVISELETANQELLQRNTKLMGYIKKMKSKNLKYKISTKDNINRIRHVKNKLQEYDGLNKSVFETLNVEEKAMIIQDQSESRLSIFGRDSDIGSVIVGGIPRGGHKQEPSFGKDEEVYATTGSSSQHRRAKSKPYMLNQDSYTKQVKLKKLERELELCEIRKPNFQRVKSDISVLMKDFQSSLKKNNQFMNLKHQPSDLSDIRFPSERWCESPINIGDIFGD